MTVFKLPDLGEGLPDAEINEWHVAVGDTVTVDQPLVSMETAKAVVEVPAPQAGVIKKLYGNVGDIVITGAPLVEFESSAETVKSDQGTVVGKIESGEQSLEESFHVGAANTGQPSTRPQATPAVRMLAKRLNVNLNQIHGSGTNGIITKTDVEAAVNNASSDHEYQPLRGARRQMALNMVKSQQEVVAVSIYDDVDVNHWDKTTDITASLIAAIVHACQQEPALNAWYDGRTQGVHQHKNVNLGIAMDTGDALFVPVLKQADTMSASECREQIDRFKHAVRDRSLPQDELTGATITLSNFGNFAGRYANPIVVPPTVAILGVGKMRQEVVAVGDESAIHKVLPLSLSFDHRAVTGGEATRFLAAVMAHLQNR